MKDYQVTLMMTLSITAKLVTLTKFKSNSREVRLNKFRGNLKDKIASKQNRS